ncbi:TPA: type 1 fimbrial protein, partial [Enterobacter asburiae]|nr:type 1 fimbrial protein [Enterobacter asburiae]
SIAPSSVDQTVDLGQISNAALNANNKSGTSTPQNFNIDLEQCDISTMKTATVTFNGTAGGQSGSLGITGTAKGASIIISESNGTPFALGTPGAAQTLVTGNNTLTFQAYLKGDGSLATITPGDFTGVATFLMNYA